MTEPSRCYVLTAAGADVTGWPTCGHVDLGTSGVVVEVLAGSWSEEAVDLGAGVVVRRRTVPAAIAAARRLPADGPRRTAIKIEAEQLAADHTIAQLVALAGQQSPPIDLAGLTLKRELVAEIIRARHPEWCSDIPRGRLSTLRDRMLAATPAQIARWAGARGIDVTECAGPAEAAAVILAALGYAP